MALPAHVLDEPAVDKNGYHRPSSAKEATGYGEQAQRSVLPLHEQSPSKSEQFAVTSAPLSG